METFLRNIDILSSNLFDISCLLFNLAGDVRLIFLHLYKEKSLKVFFQSKDLMQYQMETYGKFVPYLIENNSIKLKKRVF